MNTQLPAYLQGKPVRANRLTESASAGIGSSLPPHISIRGNAFTLIDAAGADNPIGATMDVCVIDVSDVVAKRYYGGKTWTPDSNDPPICWASNGVGPSVDAPTPQARTCDECPHNVRGSAVSRISGAAIKACRDEKLLAILHPQFPQMLFQLVLTPGSFANWRDYLKKFEGQSFDLDDVLTRIAFQPGVNGVLTFQAVAHLEDAAFVATRNRGLIEKKTDILVGRLDRPRGGGQIAAAPAPAALPRPEEIKMEVVPAGPFTGASAGSAAAIQPASTSQESAAPATPQSQEAPKRRGRPRADAAPPPPATEAPAGPFGAAAAPFRPAAAPVVAGNGAAPTGGFGIQPGVPPNAEVEASLNAVFGKA